MSYKATTFVTLNGVTYEVEGTFYPAEAYNHETPAETEHFEVDRIFADLPTQSDAEKLITVNVTDLISDDTREGIDDTINDNLEAFTENPEY